MAWKLWPFEQCSNNDNNLSNIIDLDEDDGIVKVEITLDVNNILLQKKVDYFITRLTQHFFKKFYISTYFLHFEKDVWNEDIDS